jgi:hypothetical protein
MKSDTFESFQDESDPDIKRSFEITQYDPLILLLNETSRGTRVNSFDIERL